MHGGAMKISRPPRVVFQDAEPLQDYYRDGDGNLYSVARLLDGAQDLPVFDCPLAALGLSCPIWENDCMIALSHHVRRVMDADLDVPILLDWYGGIADGRHRVIKAIVEGRRTIKARRMTWKPDPCRRADQ